MEYPSYSICIYLPTQIRLSEELRETALSGVAITPTGKALKVMLRHIIS